MAMDKRIKACPNPKCECGSNIKGNKYAVSDSYCKKCGSSLVLVCTKCFKKIEDQGPDHFLCAQCEAGKKDKKDVVLNAVKKAGAGAAALAAVAVNAAKNEAFREAAKVGKEVVKEGISLIKEQIKL